MNQNDADSFLTFAMYATWFALFAGPPLAALTVWIVRRRALALSRLVRASAVLTGVVVLSFRIGLQTDSIAANFLLCLFAFAAYCILASAAWTIRQRLVRYAIGSLTYASFIPIYAMGRGLMFVSVFVLADYLSPPLHAEQVRPSLSCRILGWGAAFSDEGYDVHLYRSFPWFPLLKLEVRKVTVNQSNPGNGPTEATCASVATQYQA